MAARRRFAAGFLVALCGQEAETGWSAQVRACGDTELANVGKDARFIALANPETVLRLIEENRTLRKLQDMALVKYQEVGDAERERCAKIADEQERAAREFGAKAERARIVAQLRDRQARFGELTDWGQAIKIEADRIERGEK